MGLIFNYFYHKLFIKRYDDNHYIHYFSYKDFDGLQAQPFSFSTPQNNILRGNFYYYKNYDKKDHLVIFCHGIGGGHRSYMREIETLCKNGFKVLSYDNTGCFESTGKDIRGFTESLNDLLSCLLYLEKTHEYDNIKIDLIGHSWGGYAVGNILNYYKKINSLCVISGSCSMKTLCDSLLKRFSKQAYKFEKKVNPTFVDSSSVDALKNTDKNVLIIHSKDDPTIPISCGLDYIKKYVDNKNIEYLAVEKKFHNPNYTVDAVNYLMTTFSAFTKQVKEKKIKTFEDKKAYFDKCDFYRMTEQDEDIWEKIFANILR